MTPEFFLVWNPNGRNPTYRHPSNSSAEAEARRLARDNIGEEFFICHAKAVAKAIDPVTVEKLDDEIPF